MFGLRKREADVAPPVLLPEKPLPIDLVQSSTSLDIYNVLASELGFLPAQLFDEQLLQFLAAEKIPVYDYNQVHLYMSALAEAQDKVWIWRPLREKDKPQGWEWRGIATEKNPSFWSGHGSFRDHEDYRSYDKVVPIHILRLVKKISDKFGDHPLFFVSDYAVPIPDPFIMVTVRDGQKVVFGVWDEPGFGIE